MREIKATPLFDIGEKVYTVERFKDTMLVVEKCKTCNGSAMGIWKRDDGATVRASCPACRGDGKRQRRIDVWRWRRGMVFVVQRIEVHCHASGKQTIHYHGERKTYHAEEKDTCASVVEATDQVTSRNDRLAAKEKVRS